MTLVQVLYAGQRWTVRRERGFGYLLVERSSLCQVVHSGATVPVADAKPTAQLPPHRQVDPPVCRRCLGRHLSFEWCAPRPSRKGA